MGEVRRSALIFVVLAALAPPAWGDNAGGAAAPDDSNTANVGGASLPPSGPLPVAHLSAPSLRVPGRPSIRVRFTGTGRSVVARVVVLREPGNAVVARIVLGSVPLGRTIRVRWRRGALRPGRYLVRVHAHDAWNRQLRRIARASGKSVLTVRARPKPKPRPRPRPRPRPSVGNLGSGVFPVAGPSSYGDGFGAPRKGYRHQGQDIVGARGLPIVVPTAGTVLYTSYQRSAAGEYVVVSAANGYSYFFAHCIRHSTIVSPGQALVAGAQVCSLGATGDATGPHLHFEVWVNGWRVSSKSAPIDPLPLLRSWAS